MKWIKYNIVQNTIGDETILTPKKVGYSEANLTIAQNEAHNGEYTIEDDGKSFDKEPIPIEGGGTGATTAKGALTKLGAEASGTAANLINRTTKVNEADTNYTTLMARGSSINSVETVPNVNGAIAWTFK